MNKERAAQIAEKAALQYENMVMSCTQVQGLVVGMVLSTFPLPLNLLSKTVFNVGIGGVLKMGC